MTLTAELLGLKYYECFAHCLNLIVNKTIDHFNLKSIDSVDVSTGSAVPQRLADLLSNFRKLVGTFNHSTQMTEELIASQTEENGKGLGKVRLIQDVITRYRNYYQFILISKRLSVY